MPENMFDQDFRNVFQNRRPKRERNPFKTVKWVGIILAALLVIMVGSYAVSLLVDYLQIREIGAQFTGTFFTDLRVKLIAQGVSFCVIFLLFYLSNLVIKKEVLDQNPEWSFLKKQWVWVLLSLVVAFIGSSLVRDGIYSRFLLFANATKFGTADPIFSQDIGYYMFSRPFLKALVDSLSSIFLFVLIYTIGLYVLLAAKGRVNSFKELFFHRRVLIHNGINLALWAVLFAISFKFRREGILFTGFGDLAGAGYTDVKVWALFYRIMPFLFLAVLVLAIWFAAKKKYKKAGISVLVLPAALLVAGVAAAILNSVVVAPNELGVESPYMKHNIAMTRKAYGLDKIKSHQIEAENTLTAQDVDQNSGIIDNVRITDYEANITALNKLQTIKPYYTFQDTDMVPYTVNGKHTILSIAARELDKDKLSQTTNLYVNNVFKYTHGYGAVVNPINQVTEQGQPVFTVRDIPITESDGMPKVTQPRIYYGEKTNDPVIVRSKISELDYGENKNYSYDGEGGIPLTFVNRVIFSALYGDYKMLISNQITSDSLLLPNRNVLERVKKVASFLSYDDDPYLIIDDNGRLKWIIDAYTLSDSYPYSQHSTDAAGNEYNYIRNSIKVVVDAYDGTPEFYVTDPSDPIAKTYQKMYPAMFEKGKMPQGIAAHVRYPEKLFTIQSNMYCRYHMTDVSAFYSQQDLWTISKERYSDEQTRNITPYYNMMDIEGLTDGGEQMILSIPYNLKNRDYLTAWLAVGSEESNYGDMVAYTFKADKENEAYGTLQVENRIDNDPQISSEMTLWGQGGSKVIRGNILVAPVKQSLLYVEPVYITTDNEAAFPELKRVIVSYGDHIAMEPTLKEAIAKIFESTGATDTTEEKKAPSESTSNVKPLAGSSQAQEELNRLISLYDSYQNYTAQKDFEKAGKALEELDHYIDSLR